MPRRHAALLVLLGLAGGLTGGFTLGAVSRHVAPDAVMAVKYETALANTDTSWSSLPENIWLSRLGGPDAQADRLLSAGDTITISGKDGHPETIEVTAREVIDGERVGIPGVRLQLITGRSARQGHRTVQFMFATGQPSDPPALPKKHGSDRVL